MASPIALGLAATALALTSTAALACEGAQCWGMAPAQEKNPGYSGPNYEAMYGPPGGYDQYGGPPGGYDQGYGYGADQGYGASGRPFAGPVEGYPVDEYQNADGSTPDAYASQDYGPPPQQYAQGYGAPPPQYGAEGAGPPMDDRYGPPPQDQGGYGPPPQDQGAYGPEAGDQGPPESYGQDGYGPPDEGGEPYADAGPPPMTDGGYGQRYAQGYAGGAQGYAAPAYGYGSEPYEGRWARGHEAFRDSGWNHGYRQRSYRSFDKSKYVYDSGWRVEYGPTEVYDLGGGYSGSFGMDAGPVGRF
jgi:hypothetical protein